MGLLSRVSSRPDSKHSDADQQAQSVIKDVDDEYDSDDADSAGDADKVGRDGTLWLDALKIKQHDATVIVERESKTPLYTLTTELVKWHKLPINQATLFFRGEVPLRPEDRDESQNPFAMFKPDKVFLQEQTGVDAPLVELKSSKFLYSEKWYTSQARFDVDGQTYALLQVLKSVTGKLILTIAGDKTKTPLCRFRPAKRLISNIRTTIEILPLAISTTADPKPNALIHNGEPTKLLNRALVAELVLRYNNHQQAISTASASAAAASAASTAAVASANC